MNIYLLTQEENTGYDTYDSAIVAAPNAKAAKKINPGGFRVWNEQGHWDFIFHDRTTRPDSDDTWANKLENINVKLIGKAASDVKKGIVLASFNAG